MPANIGQRTAQCLVQPRTVSDLHMLVSSLPTGPYPYAGLPWFNTPSVHDGLITALECLWVRPSLAKGVLHYLASTQATVVDLDKDAEPGKILHETRNGEMADSQGNAVRPVLRQRRRHTTLTSCWLVHLLSEPATWNRCKLSGPIIVECP